MALLKDFKLSIIVKKKYMISHICIDTIHSLLIKGRGGGTYAKLDMMIIKWMGHENLKCFQHR